jgi:thiamine-phosphate pyrophosphorylase
LASHLIDALSSEERSLARLIIATYQDLAIEQRDTLASFTLPEENSVDRVVRAACWELGFVAKDAQLIAKIWSSQSPSLEQFDINQWPSDLKLFQTTPMFFEPFPPCPKQLGLYVVAPTAKWVAQLAQAEVKTLQLRFKSNDPIQVDEEVHQAIEAVKPYPCRLFINDHWESAIKYHAYGIHLGQEDLDIADVAKIHQFAIRLGISSHGYAEMIRAVQYQPSYIALGAIFPTTLKQMETAPQGLGRLKKYAHLLQHHSLVGIGGIDPSNISDVLKTGVGSIAVVRAVTQAEDWRGAIQRLNRYFAST